MMVSRGTSAAFEAEHVAHFGSCFVPHGSSFHVGTARGRAPIARRVRDCMLAAPVRAVRRRDADLPRPRHGEGPGPGDAASRDGRVVELRARLEPACMAVSNPHELVHQRLSQTPPPSAVRRRAPRRCARCALRSRSGPYRRSRRGAHRRTSCSDEVQSALGGLGADYRDVVERADLRGEKYKDIAAALHVPIGTVMSRLFRARRALEVELAPFAARDYGIKRAA